jgi:hypothetical protein
MSRLFLGGAALALGLAACESHPNPARATEFHDSSGVRIAVAQGTDFTLGRTVSRVASIGGGETGPESFFGIGHAIAADTLGRLYVLDKGNHRVLVFDSTGQFLSEFGSRGGGPGEIERPEALVVDADGAVHVADFGKRGLIRYATGEPPYVIPAKHYFGGEDITVSRDRILHTRVSDGVLQMISYEPETDPQVLASRALPTG